MNVGLLGAGHISRALAEGWRLPGERPGRPEHLTLFDVLPDRAAALAADTGGVVASDARALAAASDVVVLAVRPPQVEEALREVGPALEGRALVSVAAGVPLRRLREALPEGARVGRMMPNVAAALGLGVVAFAPGTLGESRDAVAGLFAAVGTVILLAEERFDVATAVVGSMPGYAARLAQAFAAAGEAAGLTTDTARVFAIAGLHGGAALVAAEGDPAAVVASAATPGGTTAAGIAALDEHDVDGVVAAAVKAATAQATRLA